MRSRALFELGSFFTGAQYVQAQRVRRVLTQETLVRMQRFEALLTPSTSVPSTAVNVPRPELATLRPRCTLPFSVMGLPAMSVPCGFTLNGMRRSCCSA
jgi:aspartyl-tRNA(Asn)/glutamyl-tRNA(Gln) amidotransferase subunit A